MKSVAETPTEPTDYALISIAYGSLLAGLAATSRRRQPVQGGELAELAAATFALSKLVSKEKAETWVRAPFLEERPDGRQPKGRGLRYALGELVSCTRCVGAWGALGLVGLRTYAPTAGRTVTAVLAVSAGNDFLQSAFAALCARANEREAPAGEQAASARRSRAPAPTAASPR